MKSFRSHPSLMAIKSVKSHTPMRNTIPPNSISWLEAQSWQEGSPAGGFVHGTRSDYRYCILTKTYIYNGALSCLHSLPWYFHRKGLLLYFKEMNTGTLSFRKVLKKTLPDFYLQCCVSRLWEHISSQLQVKKCWVEKDLHIFTLYLSFPYFPNTFISTLLSSPFCTPQPTGTR